MAKQTEFLPLPWEQAKGAQFKEVSGPLFGEWARREPRPTFKCRECGHGMNNHHSRAMTDVYECWECGLPSQLGKIGQCDQP